MTLRGVLLKLFDKRYVLTDGANKWLYHESEAGLRDTHLRKVDGGLHPEIIADRHARNQRHKAREQTA